MIAEAETARVLGINVPRGKTRSALWISRAVTEGLPLSALESLARQVAPNDKDFVYRFVSRPILAKRRKAVLLRKDLWLSSDLPGPRTRRYIPFSEAQKASGAPRTRTYLPRSGTQNSRLSQPEGAKVARLAEVWAMARRVWGSDVEARAFLFRPNPMLDGGRPIDVVIADEFGRPLVEGILRKAPIRFGCVTAQKLDRVLKAYRIGDPNGVYPIFDAAGSRLFPGRWNTPASPMIYASSTIRPQCSKS